ncbi:transcriptional repressor LexA [Gottschalkiaceae bacterium SANA]|nr:transcriptional repressor LexA [Gottschalkiaceae bacterium SANA]
MYEDLSNKQLNILNYIKQSLMDRGYPPAVREICTAVGLKSPSTVHAHLSSLEKKGYIRKDPTKPRAIEILDRDDFSFATKREVINVPVVGKVTAGAPILAIENVEDSFPVPADFIGNKQCFMLTVRGDSMIDAGIHDGDYILVSQQKTANDGEIIVALLDDEATVKRFFKEKDRIRLQPENDLYQPIYSSDALVIGKVVGVFRQLH